VGMGKKKTTDEEELGGKSNFGVSGKRREGNFSGLRGGGDVISGRGKLKVSSNIVNRFGTKGRVPGRPLWSGIKN